MKRKHTREYKEKHFERGILNIPPDMRIRFKGSVSILPL